MAVRITPTPCRLPIEHVTLFNSVSTKTIRNSTSARISIPSIIVPSDDHATVLPFVWRTPLRSTAPYWLSTFLKLLCIFLFIFDSAGWFKGLSGTFLAARTARILVLAGTERLDKELMIGQMQGKFQIVVVPGVGHMVQEVFLPLVTTNFVRKYRFFFFFFCRTIRRDWQRS